MQDEVDLTLKSVSINPLRTKRMVERKNALLTTNDNYG